MQSHSVQLQSPGLKSRYLFLIAGRLCPECMKIILILLLYRNASVHCQASRTGSSGEYVAMLPASRPECKHSSEDYADIEEVASNPK